MSINGHELAEAIEEEAVCFSRLEKQVIALRQELADCARKSDIVAAVAPLDTKLDRIWEWVKLHLPKG